VDYRCTAPILLLFFNRPRHASAVLERVRLVQPERIYVHCDGPRKEVPGEADRVGEVRDLLRQVDWPCEVRTLFRTENQGLRKGVFGAIEWFFAQEEKGIVLEDDCLPDVSFFRFCDEMLSKYADFEEIMHIGGSNLAQRFTQDLPESYFFSKFAFVWGWASWRRAWQKMSLELEGLETFSASGKIAALTDDPLAQAYLLEKFEATQKQINNSWAYAWLYSLLKNNGLSIIPRQNLVQNTGIGEENATHTKQADRSANLYAGRLVFPLQSPLQVERSRGLDRKIFYAAQKSRFRLILWFVLKKLKLHR
jgi:hypothetical protein